MGSFGDMHSYKFYDLASVIEQPWLKRPKAKLLKFEIIPDIIEIKHSRKDYNFIDLLGDIGGISFLFTSLLGFFLTAIAEFGLIISAFN